MNLDKLHQQLEQSFNERNKHYEQAIGINLFACSLIAGKLLFQNNLKDQIKIWLQFPTGNDSSMLFFQLLSQLEQQFCPHLFSFGFELAGNLSEVTDKELRMVIAFSINNFANSATDLLTLAEGLNNNHLSHEIDELIKLIITDQCPLEVFVYGVRIINYITDIRFNRFNSYNLDKYRWREAKLSQILLQRNDLIHMDYLPRDLLDEEGYDYAIISGNQTVSIEEWQELENKYTYQQDFHYYNKLINWGSKRNFNELPDNNWLAQQIPNTDLKNADIINALYHLKPQGKLFLLLRAKAWQSDLTLPLRRFLVVNTLLNQVIFIKTSRINPWILLTITHPCMANQSIYMLNENFYVDQGLKYVLSTKQTSRLASLIATQKTVAHTAGYIDNKLAEYLHYNLDPNACLNFERSHTNKTFVTDRQIYSLESICTAIFRGTDLSNRELSDAEITVGYYLIGHSAITEDGFKPENLTPISEEIYKSYQNNYAVYPGDLITLSRATTNRLVLIPKSAPPCIASINLIVIRPNLQIIQPTFLYLLLSSKHGKALLSALEKGTNLKAISIKALKQLNLKIAPLEEQVRICERYSSTLTKYQKAREQYARSLEKIYSNLSEQGF